MVGIGAGLDHVLAPVVIGRGSQSGGQFDGVVPFYGLHQAGISTPAQTYMTFAAFDLTSDSVDDLQGLLQQWTVAATSFSRGQLYAAISAETGPRPVDTGEAIGLGPDRLTVTIGFGPGVFDSPGRDRFGVGRRGPAALGPLPRFRGDSLEPQSSGGDLCVQACADSPQVAFHAIHMFTRIAESVAALRWSQQGFGRTSSTSRYQKTPRNLMGFKDGTDNIRAEDTDAMNDFVWVQPGDSPGWMTGGSYLIARRIRILFDVWDSTSLEGQQRVIGRKKLTGPPSAPTRNTTLSTSPLLPAMANSQSPPTRTFG